MEAILLTFSCLYLVFEVRNVSMDIIDAYYYWSVENPEQPYADSLMCQFVLNIRNYVNSVTGNLNFIVIPQNGEDVWDQENVSSSLKSAYFNAGHC